MDIVLFILLGICTLGIIYCLIMLYRNNKVLKTRLWFIDNHWDLYDFLPSYSNMLYSFKPINRNYWLNYCKNKKNE